MTTLKFLREFSIFTGLRRLTLRQVTVRQITVQATMDTSLLLVRQEYRRMSRQAMALYLIESK